jgi:hypothetical protein
MICPQTGEHHPDADFDAEGLSTTGDCDCALVRSAAISMNFDTTKTPTEDGPEAHEDYGHED